MGRNSAAPQLPFAGIIQIRFKGVSHPVQRYAVHQDP